MFGATYQFIRLFDLQTGERISDFDMMSSEIRYLIHDRSEDDRDLIYVCSKDNLITIWDVTKCRSRWNDIAPVLRVSAKNSPDAIQSIEGHSGGISCMSFSNLTKRIYSSSLSKDIVQWRLYVSFCDVMTRSRDNPICWRVIGMPFLR